MIMIKLELNDDYCQMNFMQQILFPELIVAQKIPGVLKNPKI
jgi:hypothetical protein